MGNHKMVRVNHYPYLGGIAVLFPNSVWQVELPGFLMRVYHWWYWRGERKKYPWIRPPRRE